MAEPATSSWQQTLEERLDGSLAAIGSLRERLPRIVKLCETLAEVVANGGGIYTAGNGGSAAQSLHLAEELIGRYRSNRKPFRAVCLNADSTAMTCIANDFGYEEVFARQVRALVTERDALVVFSTSGQSENIVRALTAARQQHAMTIGLLGGNGGTCAPLCNHAIIVPSTDSAHIQDAHQTVLHMICERLETV